MVTKTTLKYLTFVLTLLSSPIVYPQSNTKLLSNMAKEQNGTDELSILDVTRQLTQLMIEGDTNAMNKIVDPNFTLTHVTGYVQSRKDWFAEIESERMKYYLYKEIKTSVKLNDGNATFVGQNLLDARIWGSRNTWRLQQTMQLEKRSGKWIILKSVATTF